MRVEPLSRRLHHEPHYRHPGVKLGVVAVIAQLAIELIARRDDDENGRLLGPVVAAVESLARIVERLTLVGDQETPRLLVAAARRLRSGVEEALDRFFIDRLLGIPASGSSRFNFWYDICHF